MLIYLFIKNIWLIRRYVIVFIPGLVMDPHFIVVTKMVKAGILEGVYFLIGPYGKMMALIVMMTIPMFVMTSVTILIIAI